MSVLNQSGDEQVECPLCMEPLEVDDLNFYPCTCGYQICRFCWHRIRTDENGLCPACRKAYSENPADFTPLSKEQVAQLKAEKRQKDQQRKAKLSESRKHLASVRVVQRNLVFVVGLPMRLADPEILKRHEYFGKFGKIHKVVINHSTSYAGTQGPSASAYVTYVKSDDALRAIQSVNNITLDGRQIKSSLGTTKYCSHFMKNQQCPKPDCMYLHDFGDPEASFTKEQMHAGKHQEYERKLHDALQGKMAAQAKQDASQEKPQATAKTKEQQTSNGNNNKDGWPQLNPDKKVAGSSGGSSSSNGTTEEKKIEKLNKDVESKEKNQNNNNKRGKVKTNEIKNNNNNITSKSNSVENGKSAEKSNAADSSSRKQTEIKETRKECDTKRGVDDATVDSILPNVIDDNTSFFSQNCFQKIKLAPTDVAGELDDDDSLQPLDSSVTSQILNDSFPNINTDQDWEAAFGFSSQLDDFAHGRPATKIDSLFFDLDKGYSFEKDSLLGKLKTSETYSRENGTVTNGVDVQKFVNEHKKEPNGFNTPMNGFNAYMEKQRQIHMMQQKSLEEQLALLNLKHHQQQQQQHQYIHSNHYMNGDVPTQNGGQFYFQNQYNNRANSMQFKQIRQEDDLDFDPFQETQKGLAELIESDQSLKLHVMSGNGNLQTNQLNQMNGLLQHNQSANLLPPPPPGFVQQPHMNSFGSKILPYLNMNSQQLNSTQNNWPNNYNNVLNQQTQHKGMVCNDWKVLDPAIVSSSSRYFSLGSLNERAYAPQPQQQNQMRAPYDFSGSFGNGIQIQPQQQQQQQQSTTFNFGSHLNTSSAAQNFNWFGADLGAQISSPPGFRSNGQATKQQEC